MPGATTKITVNTSIEKFYEVISDFESYPEFIPEMKDIKVNSMNEKQGEIEFALKMMGMSIEYTLKFEFDAPKEAKWTFVKGNKMKDNTGYWKLTAIDKNKVEAEYHAELTLGALIPGAVADTLVKVGLPNLMKQFKDRAESL